MIKEYPKDEKKFRPLPGKFTIHHNELNEVEYKQVFVPTSGYKKYLNEKYLHECEFKIKQIKEKIAFQEKTYGDVEPLTLMELQNAVITYKNALKQLEQPTRTKQSKPMSEPQYKLRETHKPLEYQKGMSIIELLKRTR